MATTISSSSWSSSSSFDFHINNVQFLISVICVQFAFAQGNSTAFAQSASSARCNNFLNTNFYLNSSPPAHLAEFNFGHHMNRNSDSRCSQFTTWSEVVGVTSQEELTLLQPSLFPTIFPPVIHFSPMSRGELARLRPELLHLMQELKWVPTVRLVNHIVQNMGFQLVNRTQRQLSARLKGPSAPTSPKDWIGYFSTTVGSMRMEPRVVIKHPWQKYNLLPGAQELCNKVSMWRNVRPLVHRFGSQEFPFLFESYEWPGEAFQFLQRLRYQRQRPGAGERWIFKKSEGTRSLGICMFDTLHDFSQTPCDKIVRRSPRRRQGGRRSNPRAVIQKYLTRETSYLIAGRSLRYRVYVLVTSVHPLRIYLYDAAEPLAALNVFEPTNIVTIPNEEFRRYLEEDGVTNVERLSRQIEDALIKMLFSVEGKLWAQFRKAGLNGYNGYQIWSADFILDRTGRALLMEMNRYYDLRANVKTTALIRIQLVLDTLNLVGYHFPEWTSLEGVEILREEQQSLGAKANFTTGAGAGMLPLVFDQDLYELPSTSTRTRRFGNKTLGTPPPPPLPVVEGDGAAGNKLVREEYLTPILEDLSWQEVKHLMAAEDELSRARNYRRIFPTSDTHRYLKYLQSDPPHMYMLQDAWETKFGHNRIEGIEFLRRSLSASGGARFGTRNQN